MTSEEYEAKIKDLEDRLYKMRMSKINSDNTWGKTYRELERKMFQTKNKLAEAKAIAFQMSMNVPEGLAKEAFKKICDL